jgi:hexulose-6-phosphate isomerase
MHRPVNRRRFLAVSVAAGAGLLCAGRLPAAPFGTKLHKALIGMPGRELLEHWKAAGFEGIESTDRGAEPAKAEAVRKTAEELGMRVHSVLYGWANFNDEKQVDSDLAAVKVALRAAQGYGADTVLLVPCRVGGLAMPEPWEFDIEFDEATNHLKRVVPGDNAKYQPYIEAHNHAIDTAREAVKRLIPAAEQAGVIIALENVWNNLWVKPALAANFIRSFASPWVKAYFDIGNHVKFAPPQEWIAALSDQIVKCHVKDFKLDQARSNGGTFVHPRDGSINWPAVRQALDKVGYNGWLSIEDDGLPLDEFSRRLDLIIAGK